MPGAPYRGRESSWVFSPCLAQSVAWSSFSVAGRWRCAFFSGRPESGQHYHALLRASLRELMLLSGLRSSAHQVCHFVGQR